MAALIEAYLQHVRVGKRLAPRSVDLYAAQLQQLLTQCCSSGIEFIQVERSHIRHWLARAHSQGHSPKTLALTLSCWRGFYKWLVAHDHLKLNPCLDVKTPKAGKPLPKALGVDDAVALAQFSPPAGDGSQPLWIKARDALIVELLYGCGLRVSELVGLDLDAASAKGAGKGWVDPQNGEVHVLGKGSRWRMTPLGEYAAKAYLVYQSYRCQQVAAPASESALLLSSRGSRLTRHAVWRILRERGIKAGLAARVHPHMLRHSFASHILQSSHDLRAVQELLGHRSIASTQVYTRLDFQHLAQIYDKAHPRAIAKDPEDVAST